jgi:hypothetical protein
MKITYAYGGGNKVYTPQDSATDNVRIQLHELIDLIRSNPPKQLSQVRKICKQGFDTGLTPKAVKSQIKVLKNEFPFVLLSGFCPKHHNNETLQYNGCVQIDIDFKFASGNQKAIDIKSKLNEFPFVVFSAISPSGFGVKVLVSTTNDDINLHGKVSKVLINELSEKLNIEKIYFDNLGASQPCFIPFDDQVYYNPNYTKFDPFRALYELELSERAELEKLLEEARKVRFSVNDNGDGFTVPNIKTLEYLTNQMVSSGANITEGYHQWFAVACAYGSEGEAARGLFHSISSLHHEYDFETNERKFHEGLKHGQNIGYLVNRCKDFGITINDFCKDYVRTFAPKNDTNWNKTDNVSVIENPSKNHSYTLKENQFIFHVLGGQKLDKGLYQICGGTGSGKSVFVAQNFQKTIIISRNVTTLENYNSKGFVRFIPRAKNEHYADLQSNNFEKITVTYESFEKLRKTLNLDGYTIVFDEAHLLNESFWEVKTVTKYCYNSINELSKTNTVILMSANNIHLNLPNTDFEAKLNFVKPTVCRDVNVVYNGSFEYLKDKITERLNDKKRVLLYTNRTEEKYINELIKNAFPQNSLFFFDGSKHGQTNLENLEYDITVTTSACTTGKDINTKDLAVILYGIDRNIHRSNINQFFGRARDYKSASFDLIFEFKNDNENYGKYSHSGVLNGAYDIARATIAASVNDWAFERENKDRFVTKNDGGVMVVDWFEIDNFLERQISKHTIFNTNLLDKFLRSHGYNPAIEILTDSEKEKEEKATVVSPLELYSLELDQIFDGKELETDFLTNALNRVEALQKVGYDKSDAILLAHLFGSKMKWKRFIHLLFIEGSLLMKNDKGFSNLFDKVLTALNDFYSASQIVEILQGFELQKKEKVTKLGAIIKQSKRIKNDDVKNVRFVLKNLKDYYDFDTKRTGDTRLYKIVKPDYLQGLQPSLIIVKELKKYIETL